MFERLRLPAPMTFRDGFLLLAAGILVFSCAHQCTPLSAFMLAAAPLAIGFLPADFWRWKWSLLIAIVAAMALGHIPVVMEWRQAAEWHGQLVWSATAIKAWCMAGMGLFFLMLLVRSWRKLSKRPILRWLTAAFIIVIIPAILAPLPMLYRYQTTYSVNDFPTGRRSTIFSEDGTKLDTLVIPAENPRGVMLFTHGVGRWKEFYIAHLRFLHAQGWTIVCYDLRGHGRSSPSSCSYGLREADDVVAEWKYARELANGLPVATYGVSLGGAITLLAAHRLEGCSAVIIESSFADLGALVDRFLAFPANWIGRGMCLVGAFWSPSDVRPVDAKILSHGPPLLLGWTLVDTVVPPQQSAEIARAAPRAQTVVSQTATHAGMIREPEWQAAVSQLLQALGPMP